MRPWRAGFVVGGPLEGGAPGGRGARTGCGGSGRSEFQSLPLAPRCPGASRELHSSCGGARVPPSRADTAPPASLGTVGAARFAQPRRALALSPRCRARPGLADGADARASRPTGGFRPAPGSRGLSCGALSAPRSPSPRSAHRRQGAPGGTDPGMRRRGLTGQVPGAE